MAQSAIVESIGAEEDSRIKPEGEEEAESLAEEDPRNLKWALVGQISWLAISSVLPMQSSCIRVKIKIVLDVVALTT